MSELQRRLWRTTAILGFLTVLGVIASYAGLYFAFNLDATYYDIQLDTARDTPLDRPSPDAYPRIMLGIIVIYGVAYVLPPMAIAVLADLLVLDRHMILKRCLHILGSGALALGVLVCIYFAYMQFYARTEAQRMSYLQLHFLAETLQQFLMQIVIMGIGASVWASRVTPRSIAAFLMAGGFAGVVVSILGLNPEGFVYQWNISVLPLSAVGMGVAAYLAIASLERPAATPATPTRTIPHSSARDRTHDPNATIYFPPDEE